MDDEDFKIDFPTEIAKEGRNKIRVPKLNSFVSSPSDYAPSKAPVFYNPVMELNRDVAVLALEAYQRMVNREISVCAPLASCGIRGIRFATEVRNVKQVVINDLNPKAFQLARQNVHINELSGLITVKNEDANLLLTRHGAPHLRFDAVDIDPFGSPVPYLDSAVRALRSKSLLMLTATDMGPLCGVHPQACIRKYGGKPMRAEYCKELAIRLLAGKLVTTAAQYDMGINIIFSHSTDHYIRVYATLKHGAKRSDRNIENMGRIFHCFNCLHRETQKGLFEVKHPLSCSECGSKMNLAGPLWLGTIIDAHFCEVMEKIVARKPLRLGLKIRKLLSQAKSEAGAPTTYYVMDQISKKMALPAPSPAKVVKILRNQGIPTIRTIFNPQGIKTKASISLIKKAVKQAVSDKS